ncbi:MAG: hypothetical protein NTU47_09460 [Ignavibacteriales bacterium]|nr:hypothetical protein [Ignavibacteriales bacterium]
MSRLITKSFFYLLVCTALVSVAFAGGEKLRYKMAKGTTHAYTLTSDTKTKAQMMGQDITTSAWSMFGVSITGENVGANGEMVLVAKVDTNLSKIDSPMMKDTARVMKEINGKRVRLTVTAMGKTVKSEAIDKFEASQQMQMMGGGSPADYMRGLFVKFPEQAVGVGESWKQTTPDTMNARGFNIVVKPDVTFKIVAAEKFGGYDCLKISFEGPSSQYGTGSQGGMELVIDGTIKVKGTAYFAPKEGLLVGVDQTTTTDTNISGTGEQMFTAVQSSTAASKVTLVK